MSAWRTGRQIQYSLIIIAILVVFVGVPVYFKLDKTPNCFDGKQNGSETGVDCGGSCERACSLDVLEPAVLWSRSFKVTDGVYNTVAYIQNTNKGVYAQNVPYTFRLFDSENLLVYERKGRADILPGSVFPIFEGSIFTGERDPQTTFFDFGDIVWLKGEFPLSKEISVKERALSGGETPSLRAIIENSSIEEVRDLEIVAIIYGESDNAIASSRTLIERLGKGQEREVVFTWPEPFSEEVTRTEIFPKLDI